MTRAPGRWNGRSRDERAGERRALLIAAALRLYGTLGFRNTGVRAICRDAGLTERYFYESFANGEELLLATFRQVLDEVRARIDAADRPGDRPDARARSMLTAYFAMLREDLAASRLYLVEIVGVDAAVDRAIEDSHFLLTEPLLNAYDAARTGPLARDPLLRRGVSGGLLHIALKWGADDYAAPLETVVASALALCGLALPASGARAVAPL